MLKAFIFGVACTWLARTSVSFQLNVFHVTDDGAIQADERQSAPDSATCAITPTSSSVFVFVAYQLLQAVQFFGKAADKFIFLRISVLG
jgi:hypothetical protein